jgi:hypothetical protein
MDVRVHIPSTWSPLRCSYTMPSIACKSPAGVPCDLPSHVLGSEPTGQDITSYAIVRTLGIPYAHPASSKRVVQMEPEKPSPPISKDSSDSSLSVSELPSKPSEYFTAPGEGASLGLAGYGLWSPPATRPSSPVTSRNPSRPAVSESLSPIGTSHDKHTSDNEANPHLRRRKRGPEIVVTKPTL